MLYALNPPTHKVIDLQNVRTDWTLEINQIICTFFPWIIKLIEEMNGELSQGIARAILTGRVRLGLYKMTSFQPRPQMRGNSHLKISEKSIPRVRNGKCKVLEAHTKKEISWNKVKWKRRAISSKGKAETRPQKALKTG